MTSDIELPVAYLRGYGLPKVCARTGEPADRTYRRVVYLRRWWIWLGLPFGLLLVIVLQHMCCDPLNVRIPVSRRLARRRALYGWSAAAMIPVAFTFLLWAAVEPGPVSIPVGLLSLAGFLAPLLLRAKTNVKVVRDEDVVRIGDAHPAFVAAARAQLAALTRPAPGWHPCPSGVAQYRWFDGARWTDHVAPATA